MKSRMYRGIMLALLLVTGMTLFAQYEVPGRVKADMRSADLYFKQGIFDKAYINYQKALTKFPELIPALSGVMEISFTRATEQDLVYSGEGTDASPKVVTGLGNPVEAVKLYLECGGYAKQLLAALEKPEYKATDEEELTDQTSKKDRASKILLSIRARIYNNANEHYKQRKVDEALVTIEQLIQWEPGYDLPYTLLAKIYDEKGQKDKAIESYIKAAEAQPSNDSMRRAIATMYYEMKNYTEAINWYEKALVANPKDIQSLFNIAVIYSNDIKDNEKAFEAWKKVYAMEPENQEALSVLSNLSKERNDMEGSREYLRKLIAIQKNDPEKAEDYKANFEIYCYMLYKSDLFQEAMDNGKEFLALYPDHKEMKDFIKVCESKLKKPNQKPNQRP